MEKITLWGVTASPFQLKMQSLLDYAQQPWQRWPEQGGRVAVSIMALRLERAKRRGEVKRYPSMSSALDEYPAVPFYTFDGHTFYYDSSSLANYLDQQDEVLTPPLVPADPAQAFICRLIDEAFDEFGLYMVHHMRWVGAARSTPMGAMTAREFRSLLLPGMGALFSRRMCRRQVARCPYLFSVAPKGFRAGVAAQLTPPARQDFPPTHALLDDAWRGHLAAIEHVLSVQPYLMGERFTLADASAYGQLSMNLVDPEARDLMEQLAPLTHAWLCSIRDGQHTGGGDELTLSRALRPLLGMIGETFLPLMVQNEQAYESALAQGENCFNEAAFCRDQSLYHGQLMGYPFRSVVKTFQVRVWRELKQQWQALDDARREELAVLFPLGSAACLDGLALEPA